jgi:hypothetical protein
MRNCQDRPSQYINVGIPKKSKDSLAVRSVGILDFRKFEKPNIAFIQDLKKNVGANKYKNINKNNDISGNKSKKKVKNRNSETKKIDPGNPKKIRVFKSIARNNLGHIKFNPLISVINRVLNLLATASTSKNELVDSKA